MFLHVLILLESNLFILYVKVHHFVYIASPELTKINMDHLNAILAYRLNSATGSNLFPMCDSYFILNDSSISDIDIFENPFQYCDTCPDKITTYEIKTAMSNIEIRPGF
jgi:hypothetical protein